MDQGLVHTNEIGPPNKPLHAGVSHPLRPFLLGMDTSPFRLQAAASRGEEQAGLRLL